MRAEQTESVPSLLEVWMNDGSTMTFPVSQKPVISFNDKTVSITRLDNGSIKKIEIPSANVHKYTLGNGTLTGITTMEANKTEGSVMSNGNIIIVDGQKAYSHVGIYTMDGKNVETLATDGNGCLNVNISTLSKGVYIIKTNSTTIKITK